MKLFHELVLISLGKRDGFSHTPTEADWASLYAEAQRQALIGVLLAGVEKVVASGGNKPSFLMQWIAQVLALEKRNKLLNFRCKEITDIFNCLSMRSCVLKGQGTALLYPNPLRRQCGDIDLWVEGNRDDIYKKMKSKWNVGETVIHHAEVEIFKDTPTEIHFIPSFTYNPFLYRKYKHFFKRFANEQFSNYSKDVGFAYPTLSFNAVYSLMHIFHHMLHEGIGLRQLLDYYYILRNLDKGQRSKAFEEMKHLGMEKIASAVMYVEQEMFGLESEFLLCHPNERLGKLLSAEIELAGNFGMYDKRNQCVNRKSAINVYLHNVKRNFAFFEFAPGEVLCAPIWKPFHFLWRKIKGYS